MGAFCVDDNRAFVNLIPMLLLSRRFFVVACLLLLLFACSASFAWLFLRNALVQGVTKASRS